MVLACSLSRAVYLDLGSGLKNQEFITTLKKLSARWRKKRTVYSDNAKTFELAVNWLKRVNKNEQFDEFLTGVNVR